MNNEKNSGEVSKAPMVVHVIHRLAVGGLENGLVNIINRMSPSSYRHVVVCLTDYTDFRDRITRQDVDVYSLHKKPGNDLLLYVRLWKLFRKLHPDIVHTRNIATMEALLPAMLAGVKYRVHGEHGRDTNDIHGTNRKYLFLRRVLKSLVSQFIALSVDLQDWLRLKVGVNSIKICQIYNGVDIEKFHPSRNGRDPLPMDGVVNTDDIVIGTIGRMQGEKDQLTLVKAFLVLLNRNPDYRGFLKLLLVGDGPLLKEIKELLQADQAIQNVWMPGARNDVADLYRAMDIFILPSLIEGVSNTILEAMASGLPVIATAVGGNAELVSANNTGLVVPSADPEKMADAIETYIKDEAVRRAHGAAGRARVEEVFSMENMVRSYEQVYDSTLKN